MTSPVDIELASYVSWPAFEEIDYRGWILRVADGYTKRTNSVNAIAPGSGNLAEAIAHCESFYKTRQQPAIFRLLSFVEDPALDLHLADNGYAFIDPSLVLYRALDREIEFPVGLIQMDREAWFKTFNEISGTDSSKQSIHAQILERVPETSLFTVLAHEGRPVATGLGVVHQGQFGIFDIVTRKEDRQKGHGARLIGQMLAWAYHNGGRHAYVQVVANNAPAVRLYEKLGYRRFYHYWYRIQKALPAK